MDSHILSNTVSRRKVFNQVVVDIKTVNVKGERN